jgi:hypothetical protein
MGGEGQVAGVRARDELLAAVGQALRHVERLRPVKLASSIPMTSLRQSPRPIFRLGSAGSCARRGGKRFRSPEQRLSIVGLKTAARLRSMTARRSRRISSTLLPENMGPQMTSIQPALPVTIVRRNCSGRAGARLEIQRMAPQST